MSAQILIQRGRLIDPASGLDQMGDLLIENGKIVATGENLTAAGALRLVADGHIVSPGFVDLHCHLREPGQEYKETIASGRLAAARGGFTTICCMPNTTPVIDNRSVVESVQRAAQGPGPRVLVVGAVTKGQRGEELSEMGELDAAGVVAFSDDGHPVANSRLMRHAMAYARMAGRPVIDHCQDPFLAEGGVMNEGAISMRLGLPGAPAAAEEAHIARDILLAELTGGWAHIAHLSTAGGVELVRRAKEQGLHITAEATPHHLTLTDEWVLGGENGAVDGQSRAPERLSAPKGLPPYDTNTKVNPPLRTWKDVQAVVAGLRDGTIDAIATDHAPHASIDKECEYAAAAFGMSGFETALGLILHLVHSGQVDLKIALQRLSTGPAVIAGDRLPPGVGTLQRGAPADIVVFDPEAQWVVQPERFASKGRNTPLGGVTLRGIVRNVIVDGVVVWERESHA